MVKNSRDFRVYENKIPLRLCASAFFKINPLFRDNTIKNSPSGAGGLILTQELFFLCISLAI